MTHLLAKAGRPTLAAAIAAAVFFAGAGAVSAAEQVVPVGTVIDKTNLDKYRD
jgi:hypothetical protein